MSDQNDNWESLYNFSYFANGLARIFSLSATELVLQTKLDRLHLIVSGAGSEHRPVKSPTTSPFSRACSGFVMASVGENNMEVRFFDGEGHILYSANVVDDPVD